MLSVVPTPIGHLRDITLRALDLLRSADFIACEDTRQTQKLITAYEIRKPLLSFHEHSGPARVAEILGHLKDGKNVALVSDGGMPVVSDPGFELLREVRRAGLEYEVLPGPNAALTALVASGLATDSFSFFGFLPQKSAARKKFLSTLCEREETLIFYESPFRLARALLDLREVFGDREAAVVRELTKKFEEVARGRLRELAEKFTKRPAKGEIVILVSGRGRKDIL